jgi:hypothetical protein
MEPYGGDRASPETPEARSGRGRWAAIRDAAGLFTGWAAWGFMTVALLLFVQKNSRNIPYWDDFGMVPVMSGFEPVSLRWAWAQHNEHRPVLSRLIMAGLTRFVANDFRAPRYANVVLLSAMAATMLIVARRLRGSARTSDAVLPMAILNVAQAESLMIGFAMNLIVSSLLAIAFIVVAGRTDRFRGAATPALFGLGLVLLPLSGGSGLAMVPPLFLWLAGYAAWGWWSGKRPGLATRVIVFGLLLACSAIVVFYFLGYDRPLHHPLPPSAGAVASSTIVYLSLAVYPQLSSYWWPAGLIAIVLVSATLALLASASARSQDERPRALALAAIILAMLTVAGTVGVSRAGLGPGAILASRYVTLTFPLLCALYIAWLRYGNRSARVAVHLALLSLCCATLPDAYQWSRKYGRSVRLAEEQVERGLHAHDSTAVLLKKACPAILPDPNAVLAYFRMLKAAQVGSFAEFEAAPIASVRTEGGTTRQASTRHFTPWK